MRKYFYIDNNDTQHGPCTKAELLQEGITPETLIWFAGMKDWEPAEKIDEIKDIFEPEEPTPPTYEKPKEPVHSSATITHDRPSTGLVWAILSTFFCCMPTGIIAVIYAARVDSLWESGQYEKAVSTSRIARNWAWGGILGAVVFWAIYIVLIMTLAITPLWFMQSGYI